MRITKISVKKLFGVFDHEIPLNQESRITIIYGPNGVGKTVLLRMVYGLFNFDYEFLVNTPFEELRINLDCGDWLTVCKEEDRHLKVLLVSGEESKSPPFEIDLSGSLKSLDDAVQELRPDLRRVVAIDEDIPPYWIIVGDDNKKLTGSSVALWELIGEHKALHADVYGEMPDWFKKIRRRVWPSFININRLVSQSIDHELSMDVILRSLTAKHDEYYFPRPWKAVSEASSGVSYIQKDFVRELDELAALATKYYPYEEWVMGAFEELDRHKSLIDEFADAPPEDALAALGANAQSAVFEDAEKVDGMWRGIQLLREVFNERVLYKQIEIDEEENLVFVSDDGTVIDEKRLSSGEQQLLVLYSQLIFDAEPNSLVMIDEPEISLNVVWQRNFLKDLQRIIELRGFDVLIATHSPQIIHDKWDWVVHLGERVDD